MNLCLFCGSFKLDIKETGGKPPEFYVYCENCKATGPLATDKLMAEFEWDAPSIRADQEYKLLKACIEKCNKIK